MEDFEIIRSSDTDFGQLSEAQRRKDGRCVLVRRLDKTEYQLNSMENDVNRIESFGCDIFIPYLDVIDSPSEVRLVMERSSSRTLRENLDEYLSNRQCVEEKDIMKIAVQMIVDLAKIYDSSSRNALESPVLLYLSSSRVYTQNITFDDIQIDAVPLLKLQQETRGAASSTKSSSLKVLNRSNCESFTPLKLYLSTEHMKVERENGCDTEKLDVYIFGCFLYEIATLRVPSRGKFSRMPQQYSSSLVELVKLLMCDNVALRPTFAHLMDLREELMAASLVHEPLTREISLDSLPSSVASSPMRSTHISHGSLSSLDISNELPENKRKSCASPVNLPRSCGSNNSSNSFESFRSLSDINATDDPCSINSTPDKAAHTSGPDTRGSTERSPREDSVSRDALYGTPTRRSGDKHPDASLTHERISQMDKYGSHELEYTNEHEDIHINIDPSYHLDPKYDEELLNIFVSTETSSPRNLEHVDAPNKERDPGSSTFKSSTYVASDVEESLVFYDDHNCSPVDVNFPLKLRIPEDMKAKEFKGGESKNFRDLELYLEVECRKLTQREEDVLKRELEVEEKLRALNEQENRENENLYEQITRQQEILDSKDEDIKRRLKWLENKEKDYDLKVKEVAAQIKSLKLKEEEISSIDIRKEFSTVPESPLNNPDSIHEGRKNILNSKASELETWEREMKDSQLMIQTRLKELEEREARVIKSENSLRIDVPPLRATTPPAVPHALRSPPMPPVHNEFTRRVTEYGLSVPIPDRSELLSVTLNKTSADDKLGILIQMAKDGYSADSRKRNDNGSGSDRFVYVANMSEGAKSMGEKSGLKVGDIIRYVDDFAPCEKFKSIKEITSYMKEHTELILGIQRPDFCDTDGGEDIDEDDKCLSNTPCDRETSASMDKVNAVGDGVQTSQSQERGITANVIDTQSTVLGLPTANNVEEQGMQQVAVGATSRSDGSSVSEHLNQEGLVGDGQSFHTISAAEFENLLRREAAVSKLEKDLYWSVMYIFLGLALSFVIINYQCKY